MPISADRRSEYVYVLIDKTGRFVKIGRSCVPIPRSQTINVQARRSGMDMDFLAVYFGGAKLEKTLHRDLADLRFRQSGISEGCTEFFRVDLRLLARLAQIPNPIGPYDICTHGVWTVRSACDHRFCPKPNRHYERPDVDRYVRYASNFTAGQHEWMLESVSH